MNQIPLMTNPMGKHWDQPDPLKIEIDDTHAMMDLKAFHQLLEYSESVPTGVYPGKMWKRRARGNDSDEWMLCWYVEAGIGKNNCLIRSRKILVI